MQKLEALLMSLVLVAIVRRGLITRGQDALHEAPEPAPPLALAAPRGHEPAARDALIRYLVRMQDLDPDALDDELLERAYYLVGEAHRLYWHSQYVELFPPWAGYRYVVGRADGAWTRYWSGCRRANQVYGADGTVWAGWGDADTAAVAVHPYPGLADAERVGVAVAWRNGRAYVAVLWDRETPCPALPDPEVKPQATVVLPHRPAALESEE
jgi:hypothetical protein